jgi:hypothetical protein
VSSSVSLEVVGEEGEHGGAEHGTDGREGSGGGAGGGGGRGRGLGSQGHGGRGGDQDGAGDLLHLHGFPEDRRSARPETGKKKLKGLIRKLGSSLAAI